MKQLTSIHVGMLSDWLHCSLDQRLLRLLETGACYELVMERKLQQGDVDGKGKRRGFYIHLQQPLSKPQ